MYNQMVSHGRMYNGHYEFLKEWVLRLKGSSEFMSMSEEARAKCWQRVANHANMVVSVLELYKRYGRPYT
jgi:hypothetical protein